MSGRSIKALLFSTVLLSLLIAPGVAQAYEFAGIKAEYMNAEDTGFYGLGLFTSNKRFDAEIEFFASSKVFADKASEVVNTSSNYKLYFFSFAGYFHFIRTDSVSFYIGTGIFPFLARSYAYHGTLGMDFFWGNNFRAFYNYRMLFNNASHHHYPSGSAFSAGVKYTWDLIKF